MNFNIMSQRALEDDASRVEAVEKYEVLTTPADPALSDLARLTSQVCNTPIAAVMLLDGDRMVYKATVGISVAERPRGDTPCERAIAQQGVYEVADAYLDPEHSERGIELGGRIFRYYAGAPLITPNGTVIGTVFVLDSVPRKLTVPQRDSLTIIGRQIITRLELNSRVRQMELAARLHQRTDTALNVERNFVSAVLDTVGALVAVFDTAGRIVRFNRACETISGYKSSELLGRYVWEQLIPSEDVPEAMREFEGIRTGGYPVTFENIWLTRTGSSRRISWSATALLDAQNQVAFIIATGIDVTVQRDAEATLRESEARYRELIEGSLGMVCTHDANGVLLSVNRHGAEAIGRTVDEIVGHSLLDLMFPGTEKFFPQYLGLIANTGQAEGLLHLRHLNGELRVIAYRNKLIAVPEREPYVLGFGVDVSDKIRAEGELRSLVRQSNSILESIGDGIFGVDLEGRVTVLNPAASQMLGYEAAEILGRSMHELIHHSHPDGRPYPWESCPINMSLQKRETIRVSTEVFWCKDGTSFPVDYVARPQIDTEARTADGSSIPGGRAVGVVVAFTDTTQRRALDRMKDEFISTVSHELRTPLTSLRASLGLIQSGALATKPERSRQMLEIAIGNTTGSSPSSTTFLTSNASAAARPNSTTACLASTNCSARRLPPSGLKPPGRISRSRSRRSRSMPGPIPTASRRPSTISSRTPSSSPPRAAASSSRQAARRVERSRLKSRTPAPESLRTSSSRSSSASTRSTPRTRDLAEAPVSASPSVAASSSSMAAASGPPANRTRARASSSPCRRDPRTPTPRCCEPPSRWRLSSAKSAVYGKLCLAPSGYSTPHSLRALWMQRHPIPLRSFSQDSAAILMITECSVSITSGVSSSVLQSLLDSAYTPVTTSSTSQSVSQTASTNAVSSNPLLSSSTDSSSTSSLDPLTQDLVSLLKDLASGDSTSAQADLTKLQKDLKTNSAESGVTKDLTSFLKDLASGNTTAAKSDINQLELDLGLKTSDTSSSTSTSSTSNSDSTSSTSETALEKLVTKLSTLLKSGSTDDALQAVASYLVQQGLGTGSLVNTSA